MNSPPNSSASNLPFGLPPHVSTFLPKAEAINAITGHPSQENAEARVLGNQSQEWHYQEHKHSGRYFETSNQGVGYENTSQSCQNESSGNVSTIGDGGTEQREVKVYLCDPRLSRKNGGQDLHNPHVQEKPFVPPLPDSPLLNPSPPPPPLPSLPPIPTSPPPILSPSQEPMPALPISGPSRGHPTAGHLGTKWKPKVASYQIFQPETDTASSKWNTLSTGRISRNHSTPMVPCLLSIPFPVYCINCNEYGHETRQCFIINSVKQQNKRKSEEESQGCCKRTRKGNHAIGCSSLTTLTREIGSSTEKPGISRWATGANAVAQLVGRKTPVVRISVDNNAVAASSSKMEESLQESFVTQKNIANATISTASSQSLIYEDEINQLIASGIHTLKEMIDALPSEKSNSSFLNTILTPNVAETDVTNINSNISAERSAGSKDGQKGNEKEKTSKNGDNADSQVCNICQKTKGGHVQGCFNSKKVRSLRNREKLRCEELAKKIQMRSEWFSEILKMMRSEVSFPAMPVEPPSQERPKKRPEEDELLARVEFIKRVPREELEEMVLRYIYFFEANKRNEAEELIIAKRKVLNMQNQINMLQYRLKREYKKRANQTSKPTCTIGTQVQSNDFDTSGQPNIPLPVKSLSPVHIKVEKAEANILPPSSELSTSKEDISNRTCLPSSVGNSDMAQLPCDPIVSSINTPNKIVVKAEKQCMPTLRDNSLHPEKNGEHQETTVTPRIQLPLQKSTFTDADIPYGKPALNVKNTAASSLGHPPKQLPSPADPINPSAKKNQSSKERPTNSTISRVMRHVEQQRASSSSTLQAELSTLSASMTPQRQQPSTASSSSLLNQQSYKSQRTESVQSDFRLIKSEYVKIEANKRSEATGTPRQRSDMHALGSRELPIQIE
ncbi:hypothetical protein OUZ56_027476 [Daphnia magna]|uniref:CCHC-type domain-containing protein n=1 Tax=Daphnia magna TaxID=35525 RepID=A0ABQ9ZR76_9CRUS|nr:hypothetical protein OUZ56_027476 [Daphnia magna]